MRESATSIAAATSTSAVSPTAVAVQSQRCTNREAGKAAGDGERFDRGSVQVARGTKRKDDGPDDSNRATDRTGDMSRLEERRNVLQGRFGMEAHRVWSVLQNIP